MKACIPPAATDIAAGATLTETAVELAVKVIVTAADFVGSAAEVAVSVTVAGLGTVAGAA